MKNKYCRNLYRIILTSLFLLSGVSVFATPYFSSTYHFPTALQSQNACYFNSVHIAVEAKYGARFRTKKVLQLIGFDGKSMATWEYKKKFSDLTHIVIREYNTKREFIKLIDSGEPVLVSTEIPLKSKKLIRHVSIAYSYDTSGIWVSDPLGGKRKRIVWSTVFGTNGKVKYYNLRTVSLKPYVKWNTNSKEREKKEDIWENEMLIK